MSIWFASRLIPAKSGRNALSATFPAIVNTCDHVSGMDSNFRFVSSATEKRAFFTTSAVTSPCDAYFLMLPSAMPIYCSIARAMPGAPSSMEFNSSPRRAPAAIACVSCMMAFFCSTAFAPPMINCLFTCSANAISSSLLSNAAPALSPILATICAVSKYAERERIAEAMIFCSSSSTLPPSSTSRFNLAVVPASASETPASLRIAIAPPTAAPICRTLDNKPPAACVPSRTLWLKPRCRRSPRRIASSMLSNAVSARASSSRACRMAAVSTGCAPAACIASKLFSTTCRARFMCISGAVTPS